MLKCAVLGLTLRSSSNLMEMDSEHYNMLSCVTVKAGNNTINQEEEILTQHGESAKVSQVIDSLS